MTTEKKPSALEALKNLGKKQPVAGASVIATQLADPAIAGAKRNKNTVTLGFDPAIADKAAYAAELKQALDDAQSAFSVSQAEMRDYGRTKRGLFNDTYKSDVTTVCVPYLDGKETKLIQVVCTNKYSVQRDTILGNKAEFGEHYDRLFVEETTKALKPNAEELIRGVFGEMGLEGEELNNAMKNLIDETTVVKTKENYEQESKKVPDALRAILDVSVTRSQPALKFP